MKSLDTGRAAPLDRLYINGGQCIFVSLKDDEPNDKNYGVYNEHESCPCIVCSDNKNERYSQILQC